MTKLNYYYITTILQLQSDIYPWHCIYTLQLLQETIIYGLQPIYRQHMTLHMLNMCVATITDDQVSIHIHDQTPLFGSTECGNYVFLQQKQFLHSDWSKKGLREGDSCSTISGMVQSRYN